MSAMTGERARRPGGMSVIPDNEGRRIFAETYKKITSELVLFKLHVKYVNKQKKLKVEYVREYAVDERLEPLYKSPISELTVIVHGCAKQEYGEMCTMDFVDKHGNRLRTVEYKVVRDDIELAVTAMGIP